VIQSALDKHINRQISFVVKQPSLSLTDINGHDLTYPRDAISFGNLVTPSPFVLSPLVTRVTRDDTGDNLREVARRTPTLIRGGRCQGKRESVIQLVPLSRIHREI